MELLRQDYDNFVAHELVLHTFHELGFKSELVNTIRKELKEIMLSANST